MLVAQGLLNYLGPQGWFNRTLLFIGLIHAPVRLLHNYWGVFLSLLITGLPFTFLLTLSYVSGVDPVLESAAATLGAGSASRFRTILLPLLLPGLAITFCLSFVQAFSVFPSAVLLGAPSGPTRVISIAAYDAAFEQYDYGLASAIAMIMGAVQLGLGGGGAGRARVAVSRRRAGARADGAAPVRCWRGCGWRRCGLFVGFFILNLVALIATVLLDSFATRWLGTWLPIGC